MGRAVLRGKGRRWLTSGHPWVYADDVAEAVGQPGELLPVHAPDDEPLGWALFSDASRIALRMVTRSEEQPRREFWAERMRRAVAARDRAGLLDPAGACRLLAGDADGFPGMVVDRYRDVAVVQSGCQGSDRMRDFVVELLEEALPFPLTAVLDRSDASIRRLEDLPARVEWLRGSPAGALRVEEPGLVYEVDPVAGHKTGAYLDQRDNRVRAAAHVGEGARVLDAFSYDGLFGIRAALAGASDVLCLEQNEAACERLVRNAEANGVADRVRVERTNAMRALAKIEKEKRSFDLVVCDPPAFARNRREVEGAARGYRELNRRAMGLVEPGATLVTASCSYNVKREAFLGFLAAASQGCERPAYLLACHGAAPDHPELLGLPESAYLKCAFLRIEGPL